MTIVIKSPKTMPESRRAIVLPGPRLAERQPHPRLDRVPDAHHAVRAPRRQGVFVPEGGAQDPPARPGERRPRGAARYVPQPHRPVVADRGEDLAGGRERHGVDAPLVARQPDLLLPGGRVPELDRLVEPPGGQELAVARPRQTGDPTRAVLRLLLLLGARR